MSFKMTTDYLLMCLAEECGEVIQIASKVYRFGQHDTRPGQSSYNKTNLAMEIGDLLGVVDMLKESGIDIDDEVIAVARAGKKQRIMKYIDREKSE